MGQRLPSLNPFPDDIEAEIQLLLREPGQPELEDWLLELIQSSGHMSTGDDMRWRLLCVVWLAAGFDVDKAWPYLMWLNMNEPAISNHLSEILIEAADQLNAHLQLAAWLAGFEDERLITFFKDFHVIPAQRKLQPLMSSLLLYPTHPKTGTWLADFCEGTRYNAGSYLRQWRLLAAAWYAAAFDPEQGLADLKAISGRATALSEEDNRLLTETAQEAGGLAPLTQLIADCPDSAVRSFLKDFGHPNLSALVEARLQDTPNYDYLADMAEQAAGEAEDFDTIITCLEQAKVDPKKVRLLELACGPLGSQTLLLNSAGYKTLGVDLDVPPRYLPLSGARQWLRRKRHQKAWKAATAGYYQRLTEQARLKLRWRKTKIKLADPTRLDLEDNGIDIVICSNYLHCAPDVAGLVAEAARVLKPEGLFVANIRPFSSLSGGFRADTRVPWEHLRRDLSPIAGWQRTPNRWPEQQFQEAIERCFSIRQWLPEVDPRAQTMLTSEIRTELGHYPIEELTRKQIIVVAQKS